MNKIYCVHNLLILTDGKGKGKSLEFEVY
jgi:hypothetical protein